MARIPAKKRPSGKYVIDMDPKAPVDSIPAVIDGKHPAKLDTGEYVITASDTAALGGPERVRELLDVLLNRDDAGETETADVQPGG